MTIGPDGAVRRGRWFVATVEFDNGALGTSRHRASARAQELQQLRDSTGETARSCSPGTPQRAKRVLGPGRSQETRGFHNALISEGYHPTEQLVAQGHMIGCEHSFVHEFHHFFDAIVNRRMSALWRHLRRRLPQRRDLRCDRRVGPVRAHGGYRVLITTGSMEGRGERAPTPSLAAAQKTDAHRPTAYAFRVDDRIPLVWRRCVRSKEQPS